MTPPKSTFGSIRKLPSGRFQARYRAPDGVRYSAPTTFETRTDAQKWLAVSHSELVRDVWTPPTEPAPVTQTLREYAEAWIINRDLAVRTREQYEDLLRLHIAPTFGDRAVDDINPAEVRVWHAQMAKMKVGATMRAHAYSLLRTIMHTAVADDVIATNPCRVRGAGQTKRATEIEPASLAELEALTEAMPDRYQLMVLLAAWCAMRFGELTELRRADVNLETGVIRVRRGVVRTRGGRVVKDPKSEAGKRSINIPPHLLTAVADHLRDHAAMGRDGLLFPSARGGVQLAPSSFYKVYYPARIAAGRPDLKFHHLRHTGAVLAATAGATLAELMARLGHSTPAAAMLYQHAAKDRDKVIATALSDLAKIATVTPIRSDLPDVGKP